MNKTPLLVNSPHGEFTVYSYRWIVLLCFGLASFTNAFLWISFAAIEETVADYYGVSDFWVNMLSMSFMILYLPGTLLATFIMYVKLKLNVSSSQLRRDRYGLRVGIVTAACLNLLCVVARYASSFLPSSETEVNFAITLVGQCLGALAQPFFTNSPAKLSGHWFPASQREVATTIASILNPLGNAAGSVIPAVVVSSTADIPKLYLIQLIWTAVISGGVALLFRDSPPTPPSASASQRQLLRTASLKRSTLTAEGHEHSQIDVLHQMWAECKELLHDRDFVALCIAFGVGLGIFNAFLTLIAQVVGPCGYGSDAAGVFGGCLIGCGLVGAAIIGPLLEKTKAYALILKFGMCLAVGALALFFALLHPNQYGWLCFAFGVMGFFMMPLLPVVLETAAETTYPIPEHTSSGMLLFSGQVFGIAFVLTVSALLPDSCPCFYCDSNGFVLGVTVLALLVALVFKGEHKRQQTEAAQGPTEQQTPEGWLSDDSIQSVTSERAV